MTENPQHPKITPEEVAALVAEEEGVPVEDLAAEYREHVERFGPAEVEVHGVTYTVEANEKPGGDDHDLLVHFVERLFEREPGLRQHFSDVLLGELKEEIRREAGTLSGYPVACIEAVEEKWRNDDQGRGR